MPHAPASGFPSPAFMHQTPPFTVGRGPVPRHRSGTRPPSPSVGQERLILNLFVIRRSQTTDRENTYRDDDNRGGQAPALRVSRPPPFTVGLGPSHATRACERVPLAIVHAPDPLSFCSSGSPDPDPFVIRRSQTTEVKTHIVTMEIAGDRPPRYGCQGCLPAP